jgi:tetratricopeptide (TPR) repeat protein
LVADQELASAVKSTALGKSSVSVTGDVIDSIIVTGDQNNVVGTLIVGAEAGIQELELRLEAAPGSGYTVCASIGDEQRPVTSSFENPFSELELHGALMALRGPLTADARAYGDRLFQALFTPPVLELYRLCLDRPAPVRLRLELGARELQELPWELLWDAKSEQWLVQRGTLTRGAQIPSGRPPGPIVTQSPLRVLILDLQPSSSEARSAMFNAAALEGAVSDMERGRRLNVTRSAPDSVDELEAAVARSAGVERSLDAIYVLGLAADDHRWPTESLGALMQRFDVYVAAFSTPQSPLASTAQAAMVAGPILLEQGLDAVIGVPLTGDDETDGIVFRELCSALGDGNPVDEALSRALQRQSRGETAAAIATAAPFCYLAEGEAVRFDVRTPPPVRLTLKTWRLWLHERVSASMAIAASVAIATAVVVVAPPLWTLVFPEKLPPMSGTTNIAVAEFGQINARGAVESWDTGAELAARFASDLNDRRAPLDEAAASLAGSSVEIRGPNLTRRIVGATVEAREKSASEIAGDIRADLIVSGNVSADGRRFLPEIFVSGRQGFSTVDPGFYSFGEIGLRPDANLFASVSDQQQLQQRLVQSTRSLVDFALGINAYATRSYDQAQTHFEAAAASAGLDLSAPKPSFRSADGVEMLYLLMGDLAAKRAVAAVGQSIGQRGALFAAARAHYEQALGLDREFARAYIGLAEVTYLQSMGTCPRNSASIDAEGLKSAIQFYEQAIAAGNQTPIANISAKAHFGIGRTTFCLARAGIDGYTSQGARAELGQAADAYSHEKTPRLKDWAIEAYATVGGIALLEEDYPGAAESFRKAIQLSSTQSSDELGGEGERRYLFCRNLGRVHAHIGTVPSNGTGLPEVTGEPACQQQFQEGFDLGKRGL